MTPDLFGQLIDAVDRPALVAARDHQRLVDAVRRSCHRLDDEVSHFPWIAATFSLPDDASESMNGLLTESPDDDHVATRGSVALGQGRLHAALRSPTSVLKVGRGARDAGVVSRRHEDQALP